MGPSALLSALGLWRGPEQVVPTPVDDWRDATVDVVIHANRQQPDITYCLASLLTQTHPFRQVLLIDDGGANRDHTTQIAREFACANGLALKVVERMWSLGKTPTLKRQARELDGDVLFVLDGDTVLESPDYIARCVRKLYDGVGTASVRGMHRPTRSEDRRRWAQGASFRRWIGEDGYRDPCLRRDALHRMLWWLGGAYRECMGVFQQQFLNRGQMALFGGVGPPPSTATAYRRRYLKDVFDRFEPVYGDWLTVAPDLFVALALSNEGYHNLQLAEVVAHAPGPEIQALPRLHYRCTRAFIQSCHVFDALLRSPFKWPHRGWHRHRAASRRRRAPVQEHRRVVEAYRQPFGERLTRQQGRPIGWPLFLAAVEKVCLPMALLALVTWGAWWPLSGLLVADALLWLGALTVLAPGRERAAAFAKAALVIPVRYLLMFVDLIAVLGCLVRWPSRALRRNP
jgi:glycosyltransferase involved in cell wall biosynthesis